MGGSHRSAGWLPVALMGVDTRPWWPHCSYPGAMCDIESYTYMPLLEEMGYIPTERCATNYAMLVCVRFQAPSQGHGWVSALPAPHAPRAPLAVFPPSLRGCITLRNIACCTESAPTAPHGQAVCSLYAPENMGVSSFSFNELRHFRLRVTLPQRLQLTTLA